MGQKKAIHVPVDDLVASLNGCHHKRIRQQFQGQSWHRPPKLNYYVSYLKMVLKNSLNSKCGSRKQERTSMLYIISRQVFNINKTNKRSMGHIAHLSELYSFSNFSHKTLNSQGKGQLVYSCKKKLIYTIRSLTQKYHKMQHCSS